MSEIIKEPRNISGIYFRFKNPDTGKLENRVFEDLPEEEMDKQLEGREGKWVKELAKILANKLRGICDQFDIIAKNE